MEQPMGGGFSQEQQRARNMTQIKLAHELDQSLISWIEEHADDFDKLVKRDPTILDQLAEEETYEEALKKVKKELYH